VSCGTGEFSDCPGGTTCNAGYCVPPDCTGQCAAGQTCSLVTGQCESADGGSVIPGTGGSGGASSSTSDSGNVAGSADAGAQSGSGGGAGAAGSAGVGGSTLGSGNVFGLATGGGGCACTLAHQQSSSGNVALGALALVSVLGRRKSGRRASRGRP
jgi:hypothetical protein